MKLELKSTFLIILTLIFLPGYKWIWYARARIFVCDPSQFEYFLLILCHIQFYLLHIFIFRNTCQSGFFVRNVKIIEFQSYRGKDIKNFLFVIDVLVNFEMILENLQILFILYYYLKTKSCPNFIHTDSCRLLILYSFVLCLFSFRHFISEWN